MAKELSLKERATENQTAQKSALIIAGTTVIPVGLALVEKDQTVAGIALIALGVGALVAREIIKLKK